MSYLDNPIFYLFRYMWRFSKGNRRDVVLFIVLSIFANGIYLTEPLVIAHILNIIQQEGVTQANLPTITLYALLFILLAAIFWVFHGPSRVLEQKNGFLARKNLRTYLLEGVMDLPADWHTDHHSGDTIDKVEKGAEGLFRFSTDFFEIVDIFVRLVGSVIVLSIFSLSSGFITIGFIIITFAIIIQFDKVLVRQLSQLNRAENAISAKVYDIISNISTVIILRIQKIASKDIVKAMLKPFKLYVRFQKLNETKWFLVSMMSTTMLFVVLIFFLYTSMKTGGVILVGTVYALYGYLQRTSDGFFRFAYIYSERVRQKTALLNSEELSTSFEKTEKVEQVEMGEAWSTLEVRGCEFSYDGEGEEEQHIEDVSFDIHRGEKVAFIGESGSGKTTMLKLLRGLYQPQAVEVVVDHVAVPEQFLSISDEIALIPQEPEIFTATIKDNITLGVSYSMDQVEKHADLALFSRVVAGLPHGYKSSIVEKGVNLSGGEKQRLALARGLLASEDKSIVLLDEPTSSVDSANELEIFKGVFAAFPNKTMIASVHRLHLLPLFDRVYMFDNGKIVESGTFADLKKESRQFQRLWENYKQHQ
ncbi:ABC transporter ATP-binding protein [Patescibacteria group bacterium]